MNIPGRTRWRGFLYVPIIPYRSGFAKLSLQLDRGLWTVPFRQFDLIKKTIKGRLNALAVLGLAFFFVAILPERTLRLRRIAAASVARRGVRRATLPAVSLSCGPSLGMGLALAPGRHARLHGSARL